jgi:hypothetical protein
LVADLPADAGGSPSAVAAQSAGPAKWHVFPIGGLTVRGPWRMDRHVVVASIIGGADLDLSQAELAAPEVTLTQVSILGGVQIKVPPGVRVDRSGFSLVGGTRVGGGPEPGPGAPTIHIRAFSLLGGVQIERGRPAGVGPTGRERLQGRRERLRGRRGRFLD